MSCDRLGPRAGSRASECLDVGAHLGLVSWSLEGTSGGRLRATLHHPPLALCRCVSGGSRLWVACRPPPEEGLARLKRAPLIAVLAGLTDLPSVPVLGGLIDVVTSRSPGPQAACQARDGPFLANGAALLVLPVGTSPVLPACGRWVGGAGARLVRPDLARPLPPALGLVALVGGASCVLLTQRAALARPLWLLPGGVTPSPRRKGDRPARLVARPLWRAAAGSVWPFCWCPWSAPGCSPKVPETERWLSSSFLASPSGRRRSVCCVELHPRAVCCGGGRGGV